MGPFGARGRWPCRICKSRRRDRQPSLIRAAGLHRAQDPDARRRRSSQMLLPTCVRCKDATPRHQPATVLASVASVRRLLASTARNRQNLARRDRAARRSRVASRPSCASQPSGVADRWRAKAGWRAAGQWRDRRPTARGPVATIATRSLGRPASAPGPTWPAWPGHRGGTRRSQDPRRPWRGFRRHAPGSASLPSRRHQGPP